MESKHRSTMECSVEEGVASSSALAAGSHHNAKAPREASHVPASRGKPAIPREEEGDQRPEESAEAFVDRLSLSLANIASVSFDVSTISNKAFRNNSIRKTANGEGSTGSSTRSSDALLVTASATTMTATSAMTSNSSSEEMDSSADGAQKKPAENVDAHALRLAYESHRPHHHHTLNGHHHSKPRRRHGRESAADYFGLPVPVDDLVAGECSPLKHTIVVARLPPPSTDSNGSSSASGGEGERGVEASLLEPYREPGYHTIRSTFDRLSRRDHRREKISELDFSQDHQEASASQYKKPAAKRSHVNPAPNAGEETPPKRKKSEGDMSDSGSDDNAGTNGSSSCSGTEGGYAGSASSNESAARGAGFSPSVSSSDGSMPTRKRMKLGATSMSVNPKRALISRRQESLEFSSDIADFSSGASDTEVAKTMKALQEESSSMTSASQDDSDEQDMLVTTQCHNKRSTGERMPESPPRSLQLPANNSTKSRPPAQLKADDSDLAIPTLEGKPPLLALGPDVFAHVLTYLEPPEIMDVLTAPLSKDWLNTFCKQPELWRVLCVLEPFKAQVEDSSSDDSLDSCSMDDDSEFRPRFGKFRVMYTSFVRCMKYLARIKDDALNGRAPSVIDYGGADRPTRDIGGNQNLQNFLARARGVVIRNRPEIEQAAVDSLTENSSSDEDNTSSIENGDGAVASRPRSAEPIGVVDNSDIPTRKRSRRNKSNKISKRREVRYGDSSVTRRLLLPAASGETSNTELPWSCAIYSIVNWMVAFADVEGIQTMCLKVLPFLLEDEQQRMTVQRAGLADVVLRGMVMFPDSVSLHTAAFHTIVLLARPLGGREGMLFHTSMVNASGIFNSSNPNGATRKNGIAVMLDSMRRFEHEEVLQAMSCWSLVNIALAPAQKEVLVKLGGIEVTVNAMVAHPHNAEVQFRALFALINLVIPSMVGNSAEETQENVILGEDTTAMLDESVEQIVELVVRAMKNYCSSEAILNRACLVLHNLSLTPHYHTHLLLTKNAYQMLEW
jgi:hypothetical protein